VSSPNLSDDGREDIALALILLKDFKSDGKSDPDLVLMILRLAEHLGVRKEFEDLHGKMPRMKIEPRDS